MAWRRGWRYAVSGVLVVVLLAVVAAAIAISRFDPNSLKPRITAAAAAATGRTLALNGPIGLKPSLWPTVQLRDVALSNPPGYSRPDMARLDRLEVQLAALPLLRGKVEIVRLVLVHPDILLEVDGQGQPNWRFTPASGAGSAPPAAAPSAKTESSAMPISVGDVRIEDGTVALRDDRSGRTDTAAVKLLTIRAASPDAPVHLALQAIYDNVPLTLNGTTGSLERLQQTQADTPWPVKLTLTAADASVSADGTLTHPLQGSGYNLAVDSTVPDLAALAPLLPGARLPPLHEVHLTAKVADSGGPVPRIDSATLRLGPADLGGYLPGLQLVSANVDAPPQNQPVKLTAEARRNGAPLSLAATVGAPGALVAGQPAGPVPVDVTFKAADASFVAKGAIAHPETLSGADLALNATVPDLGALAPVAGESLPPVKQIAFQGHLTDVPGGLVHGVALHDMRLTTANGDLSGELSAETGPPQRIAGKLHADRIDADAMLAALGKPVAPPPESGNAPPPAASAPGRAPSPKPAEGKLFPDTPIPFGMLRQADADLAFTADDIKSGGLDYRGIDVHAVLQGGKLAVDPVAAELPEGRLAGTLHVDADAATPPVALVMHAPALAVGPLLSAAGLPVYAAGKLKLDADLHGAGNTPHAIAAGLDGSLNMDMRNGTIDTAAVNRLLGPMLEKANMIGLAGQGGSNELRCFLLHADVHRGVADLRTLVFSSSLLTMDGGGSVNLGNETLALQLRPQGRVAGTAITVPLRVTGPIRSPEVAVDALGAAEANAGTVAGGVVTKATPLGAIAGVLGANKLLEGGGDPCAGGQAQARGQATPQQAAPKSKAPSPAGALKQLFR